MASDSDTGDALAGSEPAARAAADAFRVALPPLKPGEPPFEGPLDLILHLVKEHEVDLFDIPIARITESYLATLEALRELDIDLAGEFLHMASQLVLMKSRLLLPRTEVAEDAPAADDAGVDPRAELVRRLLEYQKYKAAGEELGSRDILERSVFVRRARAERPAAPEGPEGLADVSVFKLIEALDRALAAASPKHAHEILTDRLTISDAIARVADVLRLHRRARFEDLLAGPGARNDRSAVIATFLAILEMAKLKLVRIFQATLDEAGPGAEILVEARDTLGDGGPTVQEDYR
jgi:segregation and condensation protein A